MAAEPFDLRLVTPFVAVADSATYSSAAAELGMAPSALFERIDRLERQLRTRLLDREGRRVALTAAGERFLVEARAILLRADQVTAVLRTVPGTVRVHLVSGVVSRGLTAVIGRFLAERPEVRLVLEEGTSGQNSAALRCGDTDVAFDYPSGTPPGASYTTWIREPFVLVCGPGHRLARRAEAAWSDLEGESLLIGPPGLVDSYNAVLRAALARADVRVREVVGPRLTKAQYATSLVARGDASILLPGWSCETLPGLTCVPLTPPQDVEFGVSWYASTTNPAVQWFVALLQSLAPTRTADTAACSTPKEVG